MVTVTDAHLCTATASWTLTQPPAWYVNINGPTEACCVTTCNPNTFSTYEAIVTGAYCLPMTYEWVVVGGIITSGQNTSQITVGWNCCGTGSVTVVVTKCDGCILMKTILVAINTPPAPVITGPGTVFANQTGTQYCTPNFTGHLYTWTVVGGTVTAGQGTNCITVTWGSYPVCGCGTVTVCETDTTTGCMGCTTMNVVMLPSGENIYGYVNYDNPYNTGLNGVNLTLRNPSTGIIVATTTSGPNLGGAGEPGYFAFTSIGAGTYKLTGAYNGTWGGNNATDALLVQLHIIGLRPFNTLDSAVADVNASMYITSLDALQIKLRTIGMITSYPAGDWKFTDTTWTHGSVTNFGTLYKGQCVGDVNGSYIPVGLKEGNLLSIIEDGVVTVPVNIPFQYTIKSSTNAELGAMTLFLAYDQSKFEVEDVLTSIEGLKYVIEDGKVGLAWSNTKPIIVKDGQPVVTLRVKAKEMISEPAQLFSILPGCEFADPSANPYPNYDLKMSSILTSDLSGELTLFNYPNPFNNTTTIVYSLPESGNVKLTITNMYGKTIHTLVDGVQEAGNYTVTVDPSIVKLVPGVYLYQVELQGDNDSYVKTNKMIFTR
jgi:hypothetical protein